MWSSAALYHNEISHVSIRIRDFRNQEQTDDILLGVFMYYLYISIGYLNENHVMAMRIFMANVLHNPKETNLLHGNHHQTAHDCYIAGFVPKAGCR